jgi:hypothetical protein
MALLVFVPDNKPECEGGRGKAEVLALGGWDEQR